MIEIRDREADLKAITHAFAMYKNNQADSFQLYLALAEQGSVWSMFEVAQSYAQGRGIQCDSARAQEWFERAFAGGCQRAMLECARYAYWRGDHATCQATLQVGVDQKWASAIFWQAWYRYKRSDTRDACRAIRPMLESAASQGHPAAELLLINLMCLGKYGLLNRVRAFNWAVRAARRLKSDEACECNSDKGATA